MLRPARKKLGFTVVEILIVIVLIGLLVTIGTLSWNGVRQRAESTKITNSLTAYINAFVLYGAQEGQYPSVPHEGSYCLGDSSIPADKAQELLPTLHLPSTIKGEPARYCGTLDTNSPDRDSVWAGYPDLNKALETVSKVNDSLRSETDGYLIESYYGGIFAAYTKTSTAPDIYQVIVGAAYRQKDACPSGITGAQGAGEIEIEDSSIPVKLCMYRLNKQYPVETTGESWPPY